MFFKYISVAIILTLALTSLSGVSLAQQNKEVGAIATGHPLATIVGLEILEKGGNAFDAAVAVSAMLNVVEPCMTGIGGYGSTLIYDTNKKEIRYLNASGKFPVKTNSDLMRAPTPDYINNRKGAKSISVPGNLNAWKEMHERYGKLPWDILFEKAIYYADNGFPLSPYVARIIADSFNDFSEYSKSFYGKNGQPLSAGDILVQKDLAKTYKLIAEKGTHPFYHGEIAILVDKKMKATKSFLSIDDLKADKAEWWQPIKVNYKGYEVYTMGTPGNGFSALFALGVMEQFPLQHLKHNSADYLHLLTEILKESSKVRLNNSGDPEEKDNIENNILTNGNFIKIANSINKNSASDFEIHSGKEGLNTTHFVVVDKWGNIVSSTQTLGLGFGSKIMVEGTGIWMNNSMAFSNFEPKGNPMDPAPGKYKLSSNSPIIIMKDNKPWAALGTPGGHTIPQNVAQIIINLIDFNMGMQQAIDAPKLAFFDDANIVITENEISKKTVSLLKKKGHKIDNEHIASYIGLSGKIGNAMGVKFLYDKNNISFDIGIDKRKDGWSDTHLKAQDM